MPSTWTWPEIHSIWATRPPPFDYPARRRAEVCICWGSVVAIFGGSMATVIGGGLGNGAYLVSVAGLIVSIGGLVTAFGNQFVAVLKIWSDQRKAEREARLARHELANKLQGASFRIEELNRVLDESRARIDEQHTLIMNLSRFKDEAKSEIRVLSDAHTENAERIDCVVQAAEKVESNTETIEALRALVEAQKDRIESQKRRLDFMQAAFSKAGIPAEPEGPRP